MGLVAAPVWGQETPLLRFFDCGTVRFFEAACVPAPGAAAPPTPVTEPAPAVMPPSFAPASRVPPPPAAPADALFTSETVAPTTPPVVLRLLQEPTEANARAFLAWHRARLARLQKVQALVQRLGMVEETGPAPSAAHP